VKPEQREAGNVVVEAQAFPPARLIVALPTVATLGVRMDIVTCMTVDAGPGEVFLPRVSLVTALAGEFGVTSSQRKSRLSFVVEGDPVPSPFRVATRAVTSVATSVDVIRGMAGGAARLQLLPTEGATVAGTALRLGVAMGQREARLRCVVEDRLVPSLRSVTARAIRAEVAAVSVIRRVAGTAFGGCALVTVPGVTKAAIDASVRPLERESGRCVLELRLLESALDVARRTVVTETSAVCIVFAVTVDTSRGRFTIRLLGEMTGRTLQLAVPVPKFKIGEAVLEGFPVETEDVAVAPLMLTVAVSTERTLHARVAPMQSASGLKILGDRLVAAQATIPLLPAFEGLVAGRTVCLDLRVNFGDGTGHHQLLEVEGPRLACQHRDQQRRNFRGSLHVHGINRRAPPGHGRVRR